MITLVPHCTRVTVGVPGEAVSIFNPPESEPKELAWGVVYFSVWPVPGQTGIGRIGPHYVSAVSGKSMGERIEDNFPFRRYADPGTVIDVRRWHVDSDVQGDSYEVYWETYEDVQAEAGSDTGAPLGLPRPPVPVERRPISPPPSIESPIVNTALPQL